MNLAWQHRGSGFADTVTEVGWAGFREELVHARLIIDENPTTKECPYTYEVLQTIALGQSWSKDAAYALFREATERTPQYHGYYFAMVHHLQPRWYGEAGEWERFAEAERRRLGGDAGDAIYARIGWAMYDAMGRKLFTETDVSWETMAAGFEALVRLHPESEYLKNAGTYFAWRALDRERLRAGLAALRAPLDMTLWVNLENVRLAEAFARGDGIKDDNVESSR